MGCTGCCAKMAIYSASGRAATIITSVIAIIAIAPWVVYLGGLCKVTSVVLDDDENYFNQALRQPVIMLEWYTVAAQFINLMVAIIYGFSCGFHKSGTFLIGWFATNSAIIIMRATVRIQEINYIDEGDYEYLYQLTGLTMSSDWLPWLRCIVSGQIISAFFNFVLTIMFGVCAALNPTGDALKKAADVALAPTAV